jgi:hypothetical protein
MKDNMSIEATTPPEAQAIDPVLIERRRRGIEFAKDASLINPRSMAWQAFAACRGLGPEAFFPEKGGTTDDAKKRCEKCSVKELCLLYALAGNEAFGVWGGKSARERRAIRRRINNLRP